MNKIKKIIITGMLSSLCINSSITLAGQEINNTDKKKDKEKKLIYIPQIHHNIDIYGLIEFEAYSVKIDSHKDNSDIKLATFEFGTDITFTDWVNGKLKLLYEEDNTEPMDIDEAYFKLGNTEQFPIFLKAGKMYLPFGKFDTNMISDPLTLELGETNSYTIQAGFEYNGFYGSLYGFHGDVKKHKSNKSIKYGLNFGYNYENKENELNFDIGGGWISNILDSGSYEDWLVEIEADAMENGFKYKLNDFSSGLAIYADMKYKGFNVIAEYITQLEESKWKRYEIHTEKKLKTTIGQKISTWNLEMAYTHPIFERELTLALSYQGTNNAHDFLPKSSYLASLGVEILKGIGLKIEYCKNNFDKESDESLYTAQLSIEF